MEIKTSNFETQYLVGYLKEKRLGNFFYFFSLELTLVENVK